MVEELTIVSSSAPRRIYQASILQLPGLVFGGDAVWATTVVGVSRVKPLGLNKKKGCSSDQIGKAQV